MDTLLLDATARSPDLTRGEDVYIILPCYREDKAELQHSIGSLKRSLHVGGTTCPTMRILIFVDGAQDSPL
eukprot:CAMPEP_0172872778 /NCGR_PEP_ID=MMETSP1075-20121228/93130_1 /TAXON_ID=2916 /ORGANISM="Ceratium fusus, Strain PA161109" /LENGTH=70 /DNA_ID=CAMNT_0013723161 /DNA_START=27 /DNA_END=235 /DNA_ORIENTATION=+